ncbi:MAG: hypothetical protein M1331_00885 [Candidatus Marsarchaeota archaeon]|nr:hypothetical protein [Candidatus Marsarchaeota archaeon]MCL5105940.1 hypothetical protein [Candidatus Marsarchaeota archaeon]
MDDKKDALENGETLIFKGKQAKILLLLKTPGQNWYISKLAKESSTTYVHTCNFILNCEMAGIVESEKNGKMKRIKLTERGHAIASKIEEIYSLMSFETGHGHAAP